MRILQAAWGEEQKRREEERRLKEQKRQKQNRNPTGSRQSAHDSCLQCGVSKSNLGAWYRHPNTGRTHGNLYRTCDQQRRNAGRG